MPKTEEFFKRLGDRIRELREERHWTQKQISERGFNPNQWQQIESGDRGMNISTLLNVCEVLEVDLKTLLSGLDDGLYELGTLPSTGQTEHTEDKHLPVPEDTAE